MAVEMLAYIERRSPVHTLSGSTKLMSFYSFHQLQCSRMIPVS